MNKLNDPPLSTNRSVILHFYSQGYRCAAEIARRTKVPVRTIRYNVMKTRHKGNVEHRGGNGRPRKIPANINLSIGQWIRRYKEITVKQILRKLEQHHGLSASGWTMQRHLHRMDYRNILPRVTHMLTKEQKEKRVIWAMKHKNDDWNQTVFPNESYFQLFRNTVRRRSKTPQKELKRIPKNKQKVIVWEAIRAQGKISCHTFTSNMNAPFYIKILQNHLLPAARQQYEQQWRFQQDNDLKHRSKAAKEFLNCEVPKTID